MFLIKTGLTTLAELSLNTVEMKVAVSTINLALQSHRIMSFLLVVVPGAHLTIIVIELLMLELGQLLLALYSQHQEQVAGGNQQGQRLEMP
jgi:hypothetical protein